MAADTGSERNTPTPVKPSLKVMSARKVVVPASAPVKSTVAIILSAVSLLISSAGPRTVTVSFSVMSYASMPSGILILRMFSST